MKTALLKKLKCAKLSSICVVAARNVVVAVTAIAAAIATNFEPDPGQSGAGTVRCQDSQVIEAFKKTLPTRWQRMEPVFPQKRL